MSLAEALDVWRATRSAAIADAIDGLTATALAGWVPPTAHKNVEFQTTWLAIAEDPAKRGWVMTVLLDKLPGSDSDAKGDALVVRLKKLEKVGPDPRVARELARLLHLAPPIMGNTFVSDLAVKLLGKALDERLREQLETILPTADAYFEKRIKRILAMKFDVRKPTRAELERYASHAPKLPPKAADTAALFAEVYAHPDADDARFVLADVLQAQSDPRGEFIALQLLGETADKARIDRAEELLKKHGKDWLGDLRKVTYRCRFQRGFLTRFELAGKWNATKAGWEEHARDHSLATVEDLLTGQATSEVYKQLVLSPALSGLKRIDVWDKHSLEALAKTQAKLEHVSCGHFKRGTYEKVFAEQVLPACERIPTIKSLGFAASAFDAVKQSKLFGRLERFVLGELDEGLPIYTKCLPKDAVFEVWKWAKLEECLATRTQWNGAFRIAKEDGQLVGRIWGEWLINELVEQADALPKLARLIVQGATDEQAAHLKKLKLAVELEPAPRRIGYLSGIQK